MFSLALLAIAAPFVVSAQQVHQVVVGSSNGTLAFNPEAIFAQPGDVVNFQFHQKNHSVVRSSFASPCGALDNSLGGFNSGFMPVAPDETSNFPEYNITVMDSKPIWVYCAQVKPVPHCHQGMVFAVNCGPTGAPNSFDNFKASALALGAADASAAAAASSSAAANTAPAGTDASPSVTIPPAPAIATVTAAITLDGSTWTTTYGSYPNSPAPTPASLTGNVIKVIVGGNSTLTFNPSVVKALPRDTIEFEFQTKNHSATQSSFANPCTPLSNATSGLVGFDSGFMPVPAGSSSFPTFSVTINDTSPVWVFCKQTNPKSHCGAGMVLSINSDDSSARSSAAFAALAKQLNGTSNAAAASGSTPSTSSSAAPSPAASQTGGATRSATTLTTLGGIALVGVLMAMF